LIPQEWLELGKDTPDINTNIELELENDLLLTRETEDDNRNEEELNETEQTELSSLKRRRQIKSSTPHLQTTSNKIPNQTLNSDLSRFSSLNSIQASESIVSSNSLSTTTTTTTPTATPIKNTLSSFTPTQTTITTTQSKVLLSSSSSHKSQIPFNYSSLNQQKPHSEEHQPEEKMELRNGTTNTNPLTKTQLQKSLKVQSEGIKYSHE
jgi:hypothetical protein